jgi:hypothetical protein
MKIHSVMGLDAHSGGLCPKGTAWNASRTAQRQSL